MSDVFNAHTHTHSVVLAHANAYQTRDTFFNYCQTGNRNAIKNEVEVKRIIHIYTYIRNLCYT
jgi:hypothetical protein